MTIALWQSKRKIFIYNKKDWIRTGMSLSIKGGLYALKLGESVCAEISVKNTVRKTVINWLNCGVKSKLTLTVCWSWSSWKYWKSVSQHPFLQPPKSSQEIPVFSVSPCFCILQECLPNVNPADVKYIRQAIEIARIRYVIGKFFIYSENEGRTIKFSIDSFWEKNALGLLWSLAFTWEIIISNWMIFIFSGSLINPVKWCFQ